MNIVFLISSINTEGNGGHYYSLIETVKNLQNEHNCEVINIGTQKSKALINQDYFNVTFFDSSNFSFFNVYRQVNLYCLHKKIDVIHSFDSLAFLWARLLSNKIKCKLVLTKCGGANLFYYPFCSNTICYSLENYKFFKNLKKYKETQLYLIPNRISEFPDDEIRIKKLNDLIKKEHHNLFKFLRILRISSYYEKSLMQLIDLVQKLNSLKVRCVLIIIGTIDDQRIVDNVKRMKLDYIYLINEDLFTINAKEVINYVDGVLGTGRSFMESASKSKILLSPISQGQFPMLISENNFETAFEYNFSERISIFNYSYLENFNEIDAMLSDDNTRINLKKLSRSIFDEHFNSNSLLEKHNVVYSKEKIQTNKFLDLLLNYLFVLRKHFVKI